MPPVTRRWPRTEQTNRNHQQPHHWTPVMVALVRNNLCNTRLLHLQNRGLTFCVPCFFRFPIQPTRLRHRQRLRLSVVMLPGYVRSQRWHRLHCPLHYRPHPPPPYLLILPHPRQRRPQRAQLRTKCHKQKHYCPATDWEDNRQIVKIVQ